MANKCSVTDTTVGRHAIDDADNDGDYYYGANGHGDDADVVDDDNDDDDGNDHRKSCS